MAGYSTKPLAFKFTIPKSAAQEEPSDVVDNGDATGKEPKSDPESTDMGDSEASESELGSELGAAIKTGNGQSIYEAAYKIFSRCKG